MKTSSIKSILAVALCATSLLFVSVCSRTYGGSLTIKLRPGVAIEMVNIPGRDFKMGKYEVTQAQWEAVMGMNPSHFKGANNPVECVSWDDCQRFLMKLNELPAVKQSGLVFRLPTEAEWRYARSAGAMGAYYRLADGTEIFKQTFGQVAWFKENSDKRTHPVGCREPNAFGLYDMYGNVWEWIQDWFQKPRRPDGQDYVHYHVIEGGGWNNSDVNSDDWLPPDESNNQVGFRLVADVKNKWAEIGAERKAVVDEIVAGMVQIPGADFRMGQCEVTQAQWEAVMGENPSHFKGANNPVECVSWFDCQRFLKELNAVPAVKQSGLVFRLPTEAEWKYACLAGATNDYRRVEKEALCRLADGTEITMDTLGRVAWFSQSGGLRNVWDSRRDEATTHPVGRKEPNAFGLYDMLGNVWEWVQEEHGTQEEHAVHSWANFECGQDRLNPIVLGGSYLEGKWNISSWKDLAWEWRFWLSNRDCDIGFRLCASQNHP